MCGTCFRNGDALGLRMKYEKELKRLQQESEKESWFKPYEPVVRKETPRGQPIERRTLKTLSSKVKPTYRDEL